jgi:hypothetical protein
MAKLAVQVIWPQDCRSAQLIDEDIVDQPQEGFETCAVDSMLVHAYPEMDKRGNVAQQRAKAAAP